MKIWFDGFIDEWIFHEVAAFIQQSMNPIGRQSVFIRVHPWLKTIVGKEKTAAVIPTTAVS